MTGGTCQKARQPKTHGLTQTQQPWVSPGKLIHMLFCGLCTALGTICVGPQEHNLWQETEKPQRCAPKHVM
eukprot:5620580-Amphidinium_carterae.1